MASSRERRVVHCIDLAPPEQLKARYRAGGLGDSVVKRRLDDVLQAQLAPIRERRRALAADPAHLLSELRKGTEAARAVTEATLADVRHALGVFAF